MLVGYPKVTSWLFENLFKKFDATQSLPSLLKLRKTSKVCQMILYGERKF
jgi:hypothetical protein